MIKHVPTGLGHPYRTEPFERTPHFPIAGDEITFRVSADQSISNIEIHIDGISPVQLKMVGPAKAQDMSKYGMTDKELFSNTHLEDAAVRSGEYGEWNQWEITVNDLNSDFSYYFSSENEKTESFSVQFSTWTIFSESKIKVTENRPVPIINERWLVDSKGEAHSLRFSIPIDKSHHFVGLGERFHSVDQAGELVDSIVYEEYKGQGHRTYLTTPFVNVIGGNFGFHIVTARNCRFDIGNSNPEEMIIEIDWDGLPGEIDLNFYKGSPIEILNAYLNEVGKPLYPPDWIYSLWLSSNEWNTQARIETEIAAAKESGIRAGVVVIEAWSDETTFTVFRDAKYEITNGNDGLKATDISYPKDGAWPDPKSMIDTLHEDGFKLILWQIPVIKECGSAGSQSEVNWNYAIENKMVLTNPDGSAYKVPGFWFQNGLLPDLTDPKVRQWWTAQREYLVRDLGVDGFKTDGGEHPWSREAKYLDGENGASKNNTFAKHYSQAFHEMMLRLEKDPVTFSRAGFTGSQSFPAFWAGDENSTWKAFRASINAGITASASGFFHWGWDIGGFSGEIPSSELYLRSAAMSVFTPIMQIHSEFNHHQVPSNDRTPWNISVRHNDEELLRIFKRYSDLREKLIPYISHESKSALQTGRPILAGLFFDYPECEEIWNASTQFMFGRDLLIAPVTQGGLQESNVYLPPGDWINVWNGDQITGNQWIKYPLNRSVVPVFAKKGTDSALLKILAENSLL